MSRTTNPIKILTAFTAVSAMLGGGFLLSGCDGDSAETIFRAVSIVVTGFYVPEEGNETIVAGNTGAQVTALNLRQFGDQLEAVDNNNIIFRGTIGQAQEDTASFTLNGQTTIGQEVTISGTITVPVGSSDATMRGTWIEPSTFGAIAARASVPVNNPPSDGGSSTNGTDTGTALTMAPSGDVTQAADSTQTYRATGGTPPYTWALSAQALGTLSATTGAETRYTATAAGIQVLTLRDSANANRSANIVQSL